MTTIYRAVIERHVQYEGMENPEYEEFGFDRAKLVERQLAKAASLAPEERWRHDGASMVCDLDDTTELCMYVMAIELVC